VQAPKMGSLRRVHGVTQGRAEIRWSPEQEANLAPHVRSKGVLRVMHFIENKTCDIVGTFGRPSNSTPEVMCPLTLG